MQVLALQLPQLRLHPETSLRHTKTYASYPSTLPDNHTLLCREAVRRDLQVQRRRPLPGTPTDIVMTSMARAEPAAKVAGLANGHAPQVRANAEHDEPLGLLDAVRIGLGVAQGFPLCVFGGLDLVLGAVADEYGLAAPLDDDLSGV